MRTFFDIQADAERTGDKAELEAAYRHWMRLAPADPLPRYNLSLLLLERGEFAEGWALYEVRTEIPGHQPRPKLPFPEWKGEDVRSLLLWPEQGLGDQIQWARYVPAIKARGIAVTMLCAATLVRLFGRLDVEVIEVGSEIPVRDAWCMVGSLPHVVGDVAAEPYLSNP